MRKDHYNEETQKEAKLLKSMTLAGCKAIDGKYMDDGDYCAGAEGNYHFSSIDNVNFKPHPFVKQAPLGGDDTAGVWLMLNLLNDEVPGLYVFFRGEERGSQGSRYAITHDPGLFKGIKKAVALDRRGYTDVITTQGGRRTCSDAFANELATQLGGGYRPSGLGIHCDSAELTSLVPECTNVSVGYFDEHHPQEKLDLNFVEDLFHKLKKVEWDTLPVSKKHMQKKTWLQSLRRWWD